MSEQSKNKKLEEIVAHIHVFEKVIEESSYQKTDKFNKFVQIFNSLKKEGVSLKEHGDLSLALKKYKKALKYGEAVVNMIERNEFQKTRFYKTKNIIFLIQILLIIFMFSLPGLNTMFNLHDIILSGILIGILITLFISFFLLLYIFFKKHPS